MDISSLDEETQKYIKDLREEAKFHRIRATKAEEKTTELSDKITQRDQVVSEASAKIDELSAQIGDVSRIRIDYENLREEHAQVLVSSASESLELARLKAALDAGLPHSYADRLQGDSAETLKADAEEFKKSLPGTGPGVAFDRTDGGRVPDPDPVRTAIARHLSEKLE